MADFIDKDIFLKDVLPSCQFPTLLLAAVERQPIVHIDDMTFKIQNEIQAAKPSRTVEITFVRHGRWIVHTTWHGMFGLIHSECSECKFDRNGDLSSWKFCPNCGARMDGGADNG